MKNERVPIKKCLSLWLTIIVLMVGLASIAAVTQIDLTSQVKGILPVANGGTASATGFTSAGIIGLFTSCSGIQYLGADGACHTVTTLNFSDAEVPSGTINGSNVTFTLANTPSPAASLQCYENGVAQRAGGADYTLSTATITYGVAPPTGATLVCSYRY